MHPIDRSRRRFLRQSATAAGAAAAGLAAAAATAGAAPEVQARAPQTGTPPAPAPRGRAGAGASAARPAIVMVRGRVRSAGKALARVAISDGLSVVATDAEGRFELQASRDALIRCCVPGDQELIADEQGIARLYKPVPADATDEATVSFDLQPRAASAARHMFYVLGDPQTQTPQEMATFQKETVPDVRAVVAAHPGLPAFGVGCGDLMFDNLTLFAGYEQAVQAMGLPFVQVKGNHDLDQLGRSSEAASAPFIQRYGPSYYSFDVGKIHYIVLDDVMWHGTGFIGYVDERQLRWLEGDLALVARGRTVVLFQHVPLLSTQYRRRNERAPNLGSVVTNRTAIYRLLQPYTAHVMSAHTHENENVLENGLFEHIHGAVCGAWWTGPVGQDGSPNGYGVYEVDGETLKWHYKATGRPSTYQARIYGPGADAKQPAALIANVWNWDPEWKVTWSEDGQPPKPMEQFTGPDPLAVTLLLGPTLPKGREWIEPAPSSHMFRCTPSTTAREVRVVIVDRFGETYMETWRRGDKDPVR